MDLPHSTPAGHSAFIANAVSVLSRDSRVVGIAAGGSYISGSMDEYSDVDLVIVVSEPDLRTDTAARMQIAGRLGTLLTGFAAYHVGEPRLIICLYGPPLMKADLKFVTVEDLKVRVEDPVILYDPAGTIAEALQTSQASYPQPNRQWIEDAFWVWIQYAAAKIRRGELLEARAILNFLIEKVLGPFSLLEGGNQPSGVRRIELLAADRAASIAGLYVPLERKALKEAVRRAASQYVSLRKDVDCRESAQQEVLRYLAES